MKIGKAPWLGLGLLLLGTGACRFEEQPVDEHSCSATSPKCPEGYRCAGTRCVKEGVDLRPGDLLPGDQPSQNDAPPATDGVVIKEMAGKDAAIKEASTKDLAVSDLRPPDLVPPPDGPCSGDASQACYTGPAGTNGVGVCKSGLKSCSGSSWGPCIGEVVPAAAELCDAKDNDCDKQVDEIFACIQGVTANCTTACLSTGTKVCSPTCAWGNCVPPKEICNGLDDDCVGGADNGFACVKGASEPCTSCGPLDGTRTCSASCTWGSCVPPAEVCNGVDDDCDGAADNGLTMVTYYEDDDKDGYGNPAVPKQDCKTPYGYVKNKDDCYDGNDKARPGQTAFFTVHRGDGSFDYDCNGSVTKLYTSPAQPCTQGPNNTCMGWAGMFCGTMSAPACGNALSVWQCGTYPNCAGSCVSGFTQSCR